MPSPAHDTLDRLRLVSTASLTHATVRALAAPIGCGGVAVHPGDMIVGDRDGVIVIPLAMADEVTHGAAEQEELAAFLLRRVADGAYPLNEATKAAFEQWRGMRRRR